MRAIKIITQCEKVQNDIYPWTKAMNNIMRLLSEESDDNQLNIEINKVLAEHNIAPLIEKIRAIAKKHI